jgi:hypothetical protein
MRKVLAISLALVLVMSWALTWVQPDFGVAHAQEGRPPRLDNIRPETITSGAPTFTVRLKGRRFDEGAKVVLDGVPLDSSRVSGDGTLLLAEIDASVVAVTGTHTLQAMNPDGMTSGTETLTVVEPDPELRIQFDASNAAQEDSASGFIFPIRGEGFRRNSRVIVWGKAGPTNFIDETQMQGFIDPSLLGDPARVPVMVRNKGGRLSNVQIFFVVPRPVRLSSVDPDTVEVGSEDFEIEVSGAGFNPGAKLIVDGQELEITRFRDGRLEATVPGALRAEPRLLSVRVEQDGIQSSDLVIAVAPSEEPFIYAMLLRSSVRARHASLLP